MIMDVHNFFLFDLEKFTPFVISFISILSIILIILAINSYRFYSGTPPGPWGIPLFGYTLFLNSESYKDFLKMGKKYGEIFSIGVGPNCCVILNSYKTIKEGFTKYKVIVDGRQKTGFNTEFSDDKMIALIEGNNWRIQRNFLRGALKDFGFEKSQLEMQIHKETNIAVERMLELKNQPFELNPVIYPLIANLMCYFMLGRRFSDDEEHIVEAIKDIDLVMHNFGFCSASNALSHIMKYFPNQLTGADVLFKSKQTLYDFIEKVASHHEKTYDEYQIRDLVDVYLTKLKTTPVNDSDRGFKQIYTKPYIRANVTNLFIAGTETTSALLNWTFRTLAAHPKVQERLQKEIDDVIGSDGQSTLEDMNRMPYTEAVMLEMMRYASITPVTPLAHRVTEDIELMGYRIPKDFLIVANFWSVHYDPELWNNPDVFDPERFLDQGEVVGKLREYVMAFSIGKRRCLGEYLARMEYFLVLTAVLQKVSFNLPEGDTWPFESTSNVPVRKCAKNKICAVHRH